jgi:hypothetical protein
VSLVTQLSNHFQREKLIVTELVKKSLALMEPEIDYSFHKSPLLRPIMSQLNPVHTLTPIFLISILIFTFYLRLNRIKTDELVLFKPG